MNPTFYILEWENGCGDPFNEYACQPKNAQELEEFINEIMNTYAPNESPPRPKDIDEYYLECLEYHPDNGLPPTMWLWDDPTEEYEIYYEVALEYED